MNEIAPNYNGIGLHIGVVQSRFSNGIGRQLLQSCVGCLKKLGVKNKHISIVTVPGALEIPLALQNMALSKRFDALVALGVVIRGETYHFELVANESAAGVSRVGLDFNIPIANAILTTEDEAQALARMHVKGAAAAKVAVEMANLLKKNKF